LGAELGAAQGLSLDLTADQFGGPKTLIAPARQQPHQLPQYRAGRIDTATNAAKARRQTLVTEALKHSASL
jgi:hypothetical protein